MRTPTAGETMVPPRTSCFHILRRGAWGSPSLEPVVPTQKKFTEPVALSSTQPVDFSLPRRAFELSFDLIALRARCRSESRAATTGSQVPVSRNLSQIAELVLRLNFASNFRSTTKCTEPVASPSGSSTDRRRSDCRSESHQPRTLRARCKCDSRVCPPGRQGVTNPKMRSLRIFLFASTRLAFSPCALARTALERKYGTGRGPSRKNSPSRVRFRPPPRVTFRFRVPPPGEAST